MAQSNASSKRSKKFLLKAAALGAGAGAILIGCSSNQPLNGSEVIPAGTEAHDAGPDGTFHGVSVQDASQDSPITFDGAAIVDAGTSVNDAGQDGDLGDASNDGGTE